MDDVFSRGRDVIKRSLEASRFEQHPIIRELREIIAKLKELDARQAMLLASVHTTANASLWSPAPMSAEERVKALSAQSTVFAFQKEEREIQDLFQVRYTALLNGNDSDLKSYAYERVHKQFYAMTHLIFLSRMHALSVLRIPSDMDAVRTERRKTDPEEIARLSGVRKEFDVAREVRARALREAHEREAEAQTLVGALPPPLGNDAVWAEEALRPEERDAQDRFQVVGERINYLADVYTHGFEGDFLSEAEVGAATAELFLQNGVVPKGWIQKIQSDFKKRDGRPERIGMFTHQDMLQDLLSGGALTEEEYRTLYEELHAGFHEIHEVASRFYELSMRERSRALRQRPREAEDEASV